MVEKIRLGQGSWGRDAMHPLLEVYRTGDLKSGAGSDLCRTFFEVSMIGLDRHFWTLTETSLLFHRISQLIN